MARETMADLITAVRGLIADPAGEDLPDPIYSDDEIERALDASCFTTSRTEHRGVYARMTALTSVLYKAQLAAWESGAFNIVDRAGSAVTPATEGTDLLAGRFTFAAPPVAPLTIEGLSYDIGEAAAKVLEVGASSFADRYATRSDAAEQNPQEAAQGLRDQATALRTSHSRLLIV